MKNLHLLPTDKPSRLHLGNSGLVLCESVLSKYTINGQHICITNDEEIKDGDWFLEDNIENLIFQRRNSKVYSLPDSAKKIILTTDQDLIKDGVQPIDDEFLEWFVKNPSCEEVEIEDTCLEVRVCDCAMNENCLKPGYTIIIPQEEPKQELNLNCFDCNKSLQYCTCMEDTINMKQETLQEVKDLSYYKANAEENYLAVPISVLRYISELEERMYSEEELKSTFKIGFNIGYGSTVQELDLKNEHCDKWFEQFKKT